MGLGATFSVLVQRLDWACIVGRRGLLTRLDLCRELAETLGVSLKALVEVCTSLFDRQLTERLPFA